MDKPTMLMMPTPLGIPHISDKLLNKLAQKIKPVVRAEDGKLFYIEDVNLRNIAFTFSPKLTTPAADLMPVVRMRTLHNYGAPVFFKPSVSEVLAQIPAGYIDVVTAFETEPNREYINGWSQSDRIAMSWGYHIGVTTLYKPE